MEKVKLTPTTDHKLTVYRCGCLPLAIAMSGLLTLIYPTVAAELPIIENQATATYEDPENPNESGLINTVSISCGLPCGR